MNYPLIKDKKDYFGWTAEPITNCTECTITQTESDFTASLTLCSHDVWSRIDVEGLLYTPFISDILSIKHIDGNYYDFKVDSFSYSNGTYSVTAKYIAYETGGIVNEPIVGMYTPKEIIEFLESHLHGAPLASHATCDINDRYCGIAVINPQLYRSTLYNQVIGSTGFYIVPYNRNGYKLVDSIGSNTLKVLSTSKDIISYSIESKAPSKPSEVIGFYKFDDDETRLFDEEPGYIVYASSVDDYENADTGFGELYDAKNDLKNSDWYPNENSLANYCYKKHLDLNNKFYSYPEVTISAELSPDCMDLSLGDRVRFYDEQYEGSELSEDYTITSIEYDSLNGRVLSIVAGDISKNVSDIIASQESTIESYGYLDECVTELTSEDFDENLEHEFVVGHYNEGDVVSVEFDSAGYYVSYSYTRKFNPRISSIDGNVFKLKIDTPIEEYDSVNFSWWLRYIQRTEHELYDTGDLCDNTWSNYSTSYLSFDATKISLKSGGVARACTTNNISLLGYKRLVIEYSFTTYKAVKIGFNTTSSTAASNPNMFYCTLAKGGTKASVEIPDDYAESNGYLKIYGTSGAVGQITKIYLQSK